MSQLAVDGFRAEREAILDDREGPLRRRVAAAVGVRGLDGPRRHGPHGVHAARRHRPRVPARHRRAAPSASMEPAVAERRTWPIEAVIEEYETYSGQAADVFASVQDAAAVGDACCRWASSARTRCRSCRARSCSTATRTCATTSSTPNGSIDRAAAAARREAPAPDDRMDARRPAVDVRRRSSRAIVDRPLVLTLDGPGGGTWTIAPGGDDGRVRVTEGASRRRGRHRARAPTTTSSSGARGARRGATT